MNITEDYVSFETAKLLKEKGFDCETDMYYSPEGELKCWIPNGLKSWLDNKGNETWWWKCVAPTLQMARKWLRKVHGVTIIIDTNDIWLGEGNRFYWCKIYYKMGSRIEIKWYNDHSKPKDILRYQTYEKAAEAAIKYCLENLV